MYLAIKFSRLSGCVTKGVPPFVHACPYTREREWPLLILAAAFSDQFGLRCDGGWLCCMFAALVTELYINIG